jgi:hypothetical protein
MNRNFQRLDVPRHSCRLLLAIALVLAGCDSGGDRTLEQTIEQVYKIEPNAAISIRNTDGSIRIYGANSNELKLYATKRAYRQDRLERIAVNVKVQPSLVSIDTIYPPKPRLGLTDRSGTVDYVLLVPDTCTIMRAELTNGEVLLEGLRGKSARANLVNGHLTDHNCFADTQLFVANGTLDIGYDWWEKRKFAIEARIVNGNARALVPGEASFHLVAGTEDGNIANEFSEQEDRGDGPLKRIDAVVGSPSEVDITLQATNGNIRIAESDP